jgi:hypothetical protein
MKDSTHQTEQKVFSNPARSLLRIIIASLLIFALCIPYVGSNVNAESYATKQSVSNGIYTANDSKMVFNTTYYYDSAIIYATDKSSAFSKVTSADPKVATVSALQTNRFSESFVLVYPKKAGNTYITMTDINGLTTKMLVTVSEGYFPKNLKSCTSVHMYYGSTNNVFYTKPYAKVRLTIAGKTRIKTASKYGKVVFKISKIYKIGQKYTVKVYWHKIKISLTEKIRSNSPSAYHDTIRSCESYVPFYFKNVTRGDKVTLYIGNERHSFTVPYTTSKYHHKFYTKYTMRHYNSMRIVIKNKYKQKMYSNTFYINWN